jgi:hypothetical protein
MWLVFWLLVALVSQDKLTEQRKPTPQKNSAQSAAPASPPIAKKADVERAPAQPKEPIVQQNSQDTSTHDGSVLHKAFAPDTWPTWALVLVGAVAAYIAIRTLKAIEHEAEIGGEIAAAARDNAVAAKTNALALIVENRPWLLIDKLEVPYLTPAVEVPPEEQRFSHCFVMTKNHGKTPAKVITVWARMQIGDNPMKPPMELSVQISQTPPVPEPYIFPPGEVKAAEATLWSGFISGQDRDAVLVNKTKYLWLFGFVKYLDTFEREQHAEYETRFCFLYETRLNAPKPFWTPAGPPEYNTAT